MGKTAREAASEWSRRAARDIDGKTERSKWAGAHESMRGQQTSFKTLLRNRLTKTASQKFRPDLAFSAHRVKSPRPRRAPFRAGSIRFLRAAFHSYFGSADLNIFSGPRRRRLRPERPPWVHRFFSCHTNSSQLSRR